jgi:hypothetical protein
MRQKMFEKEMRQKEFQEIITSPNIPSPINSINTFFTSFTYPVKNV